MQEGQVTIEGETLPLPAPFLVLATQNPIEYEGTFPLPEAQLDRFMLKLTVGYPSMEEEKLILRRRRERRQDEVALREITQANQVLEMREAVENVHVNADLENYIAALVHATRCGSPRFRGRESARVAGFSQDRPRQCRHRKSRFHYAR